jgi:hypothetical protein
MPRRIKNTRPRDTSKNRARKDKKKSLMRTGAQNGAWKGGSSAHYYRRSAGAKAGEVVHHKNKKKSDNRKSNLSRVSAAKHNKLHPEKGRKAARARKR